MKKNFLTNVSSRFLKRGFKNPFKEFLQPNQDKAF